MARTTTRPLVAFLYALVQDELPAGVVERLMENLKMPFERLPDGGWQLSNERIAAYAEELAVALDDKPEETQYAVHVDGEFPVTPFEGDTMTHEDIATEPDAPAVETDEDLPEEIG